MDGRFFSNFVVGENLTSFSTFNKIHENIKNIILRKDMIFLQDDRIFPSIKGFTPLILDSKKMSQELSTPLMSLAFCWKSRLYGRDVTKRVTTFSTQQQTSYFTKFSDKFIKFEPKKKFFLSLNDFWFTKMCFRVVKRRTIEAKAKI